MEPEDWSKRYREGRTGWDIGRSPEGLSEFLGGLPPGQRILVPGCGRGHEIRDFRAAGHEVCAIDYSEGAVAAARANLAVYGDCVYLADFFSCDLPSGSFDLCYERTFLCAIPVERRREYVRRVADLLRPAGLLAGFFLYGEPGEEGPPFPLAAVERQQLLGPAFSLCESRPTRSTFTPLPAADEYWEVWRRL